ncbi:kinase-like domain-containing protein [Mucor lusitanicus]|uniref:non-specific serine/threonine protein kinase n=1 Tax=Mucor circinelloides f. lusitanicus TaxID=29924 RepID=A0A8H4BBN2_MUCCL|nr:kinase-like domain-containing protein [Mucor lusitanicus]
MEYSSKDVIVGDQWLVLSKIGEGSFGEVFKAKDIDLNRFYAIKRESLELEYPQLHHESVMYDVLAGGPCIPKCHWYGQHDGFDCIVIDLLGSSLKDLQATVRDIPLDIVIDLGCQLISCLEHMHDRGIVYRDIKPENFLFPASCILGDNIEMNWSSYATYDPENSPPPSPPSCRTVFNNWGKQTSLYAVDFGLATWWRNPKTKKPYPECKKPIKFKTGTARYASLNVHRGRTHSRRDDMESLGYLLLDLLLAGELPWSGVTARSSKAGWDRLKEIKEEMLLEDMCLGLPHGIMDFIDYTRRLRFNDRPDYDHLRRLLRGCNETGPFSRLVTPHPYSRMIPSPPKYQQHQQKHNIPQQHHYSQQPRQKKYHARERSNESYYKRPSRSASYKSKTSSNHTNSIGDQQDDVFVMDDLMKELAPISTTPSPPLHTHQGYQKKRYEKSNTNQHRNNNYRYHSSSSQHQQYYKYGQHAQQKRHQTRPHVGWNSHKHGPQQQQQQDQQWEGHHHHPQHSGKNNLQQQTP